MLINDNDGEMTSGIIHLEKQAISSEKQAQAACDESEQLHVVLFNARSQRDNAQQQTASLTVVVLHLFLKDVLLTRNKCTIIV